MTAAFYGTAAAVKLRTGVGPEDLGLESVAALDTAIADMLTEATDLMNRRMRRTVGGVATAWNEDTTLTAIPAGLHGIANDIVAQTVRDMVATRQTPVVRVDDFAVRTLPARVFTPDIDRRLRMYGSVGVGQVDVAAGIAPSTATVVDLNAG